MALLPARCARTLCDPPGVISHRHARVSGNRCVVPAFVFACEMLRTQVKAQRKISQRAARRASETFNSSLFNSSLILFEMLARARGLGGWPKIIARNRWFQRKVVSFLRSHLRKGASAPTELYALNYRAQPVSLSYSYTALEPFRYAKAHGWKTLLVQIDPGPEEERIVAEEAARVPQLAADWQAAPAEYWAAWREECKLADRIVVNSEWSREGVDSRRSSRREVINYSAGVRSARNQSQKSASQRRAIVSRRASRSSGRCACCFLV